MARACRKRWTGFWSIQSGRLIIIPDTSGTAVLPNTCLVLRMAARLRPLGTGYRIE